MKDKIKSYLELNESGALMLTGSWGCGKTYFINNELKLFLESEGYIPIIVSLFGIQTISEITNKVFDKYSDRNKKIYLAKARQKLHRLIDKTSYIKNYIDINGLIDVAGNIYKIIDKKTVICFDDFERLSSKIEKADFLGYVNEIIEIYNLKVIIIANEIEIQKIDLEFKEKVISKTIEFIPDFQQITKNTIKSYNSTFFNKFMLENKLVENTLNSSFGKFESEILIKLQKDLSNIRTIKFALNHFFEIFKNLTNNDDYDDDFKKFLDNIWVFVLSVSIEFKNNQLSYKDRKHLDSYIKLPDFSDLSSSQKKSEKNNEYNFGNKFTDIYFQRFNENFFFYEDIYNFITAGDCINYGKLKELFKTRLEEAKSIPSVALWQEFSNGIWKMTDKEFIEKLSKLTEFTARGELIGLSIYVQVGVFLFPFCNFINKNKDEVTKIIENGVDLYIAKMTNSITESISFDMIKHHYKEPEIQLIINYIEKKRKEQENIELNKKAREFEQLLKMDLSSFCSKFTSQNSTTSDYLNIPILHLIDKNIIKDRILSLSANDAIILEVFAKERYIDNSYNNYLQIEKEFLITIRHILDEIDINNASLSHYFIKNNLIPTIIESIKCLEVQN